MLLRRSFLPLVLSLLLFVPAVVAQDLHQQIREEGLERSQYMEKLHVLVDRYGPRLTGSPQIDDAGRWALERLGSYGLSRAARVPWEWGRVGWTNEYVAAHMVEPVSTALLVEVLGWTPSTGGAVRAEAVHVRPPSRATDEVLAQFFDDIRDAVRGRIVLIGQITPSAVQEASISRRADEDLERMFAAVPGQQAAPPRRAQAAPDPGVLTPAAISARIDDFLREMDVPVRVNASGEDFLLVRAFSNRTYDPDRVVPTVVMPNEHFGRITRLLASGHNVVLEFDIRNTIYPEAHTQYNYTADIVGSEFPDEVVIIGGHLDSWHSATGATDNAAGVTVMMEAVRILQAVDARPRRSIRVAMWNGEEQGLLGSLAYVEQQFGSFENPKPAYDDFAGYINVDSGTGRLRGAVVFGPEEAGEMLRHILEPLRDLGVVGATSTATRALGGSDHTSFNNAGLPGIGMLQDPIQYFSHTWHTNLDTYERILEDDMKQAAVVIAILALELANADSPLPRFSQEAMPAP
jgi:carboxypeptidase Q